MALRNFAHHRLYSLINVLGLSVALTCATFVILFVRNELSYDRWIPGTRNLYRVELTLHLPGRAPFGIAATPYPLGGAMRAQIPGVAAVTHLFQTSLTLTRASRQYLEDKVDFVDPDFFRLIRLPFLAGDPRLALSQPESVVLTQSAARKFFGGADPIGRMLVTDRAGCPRHEAPCGSRTVSLRVTGVVRDLPQNTQLSAEVFIPTASRADPDSPRVRSHWLATDLYTYVALAPKARPASVLAAIPAVLDQDMTGTMRASGMPVRASQFYTAHLTRFSQVHLSSARWQGNLTPPGSWVTLYGVIAIGVLILLLACFNFTNLATARAALRGREIGLRKTLGASRGELARQFLSEAVVVALASLVLAGAAAEVLRPVLERFLHRPLALDFLRDPRLDLMLLGVAVGAGLISGIYPALVLSSRRPLAALEGSESGSQTAVGLRDLLVLLQFAVSIGLGVAVLVVFRQVDYARALSLGFRRDDIVVIRNSVLTGQRQEAFAQALRANPGIRGVGLSEFVPFHGGSSGQSIRLPGQAARVTLNYLPIDPGYPRTYGIRLVAGRLLSGTRGEDRLASARGRRELSNVLINVAGVRRLGLTPRMAVGSRMQMGPYRVRIVGVLADTRVQGAWEPAAPTVYAYDPEMPLDLSVRLSPGQIPATLRFVDRTWHAFAPTVAIQRGFLSASFQRFYRSGQRQGTVFTAFVIIAVFIACLGLYGLVVFTAERRTREIAIRKISGAHTRDLVRLMLWRISVPILIANAIAWPLTYYYLTRWLDRYAYHIGLSPAYFLAAGTLALLIAWATVLLHTVHLASASPVHALRSE